MSLLFSMGVLGTCLVGTVSADGPSTRPPVTDLALRDGGFLAGQVVDPQGVPLAKVRVSIQDEQGQEVVATVTDQQGRFAVAGLRGGVYPIVTPQARRIYRLWAPGTAPPSAQQGAMIVSGDTIRGAGGQGGLTSFLTNPLVIGGAVATAIAVPVAIHNSNRNRPASP
jgi:hypothetical protein